MDIKHWKTSELIDFMNSYNRVFEVNNSECIAYENLYCDAFEELLVRIPLMALLY